MRVEQRQGCWVESFHAASVIKPSNAGSERANCALRPPMHAELAASITISAGSKLRYSARQSRPAPGGSDAPLHGVDRLNERPNGHEGDRHHTHPLDAAVDASSDLPAHGRPMSNAYCPSLPPAIPTIIAHDPARRSPPRQSAACHLRHLLDFPISRLVVLVHVYQLAAARSLPLTILHLASP
jgi:hypothetical protein